ncbi:low temperature requirement protein A [Nonomuraea sp. NPDC049709]|uniref:low temperature requirement protein A n=1 Tax=Nonomuraea sp. NPDC049709 TaxID=3154736 RepID=UPI003448372E
MSSPAARFRLGTSTSGGGRVTPTELFFDLVFVFVVTQVTHAVERHPGWEGLFKGLLPMVVVWWMFSAFGWLTNAVRPDAVGVRILLILAMMAFFVMGLDVPYAFEPEGWAFPVAYLAVVAIHCGVYLTASAPTARRAILRNMPFNAAAGVLVLVAPHLPEVWGWVCWAAAVPVLYLSPFLGRIRGFVIEPHHFVERHALLLLVVLGESVVAIGIGAESPQGHAVDWPLALGVILGIAAAAGLWWVYFDGDEVRAEAAFEKATEHRRQTLAYYAFTGAHLVMIIGGHPRRGGHHRRHPPLRRPGEPVVAGLGHRDLPGRTRRLPRHAEERPDRRSRRRSGVRGAAGGGGVVRGLGRHGRRRGRADRDRHDRSPPGLMRSGLPRP